MENNEFKNNREKKKITQDLKKIQKELDYIIHDDPVLAKL